jgi:formylglycine-generating enzyme required for sulfatase activity
MQPGDVQLSCDQLKAQADKTAEAVAVLSKQIQSGQDSVTDAQGFSSLTTNGSAAALASFAAQGQATENAAKIQIRDLYQKRHDFMMSQFFTKKCGEASATATTNSGSGNVVSQGPSNGELPAQVQADLLRNKVIAAARNNDLQGALSDIDQYKRLGVPIPAPLSMVEATASYNAGDFLRANRALRDFLSVAPRGTPAYEEGLALYPKYEAAAAPVLKKAHEAQQAQEIAAQAKVEAALSRVSEVVNQVRDQMVPLPTKRCQIGSRADENWPERTLTINSIKMQKYAVTFDQYDTFAIATRRSVPSVPHEPQFSQGNYPVVQVSLSDAEAFAHWMSDQTGLHFRLPNQIEFECAARAGTRTTWWWGNQYQVGNEVLGVPGGQRYAAEQVGQLRPNPWGLYDMVGNVENYVEGKLAFFEPASKTWTVFCGNEPGALGQIWYQDTDLDDPYATNCVNNGPESYLGFRLVQDL